MTSGVRIDWNKNELQNLYRKQQMHCSEIARMKNVSQSAVRKAMARLGIRKRTLSEVHKLLCLKKPPSEPPHYCGDKHPRWKGGRRKTSHGYILIHMPKHPRANRGEVFEHIVVWEKIHGTPVPDGYIIHHLNGVRDDNRPENLVDVPNFRHPPFTFQRLLQQRIRQLESQIEVGEIRMAIRDLVLEET